jgi:DNA-binding Lrp family transcriptional regulator
VDSVDRGLVHALHLDGRASYRAIAETLGLSENTVARRYRQIQPMETAPVIRTVERAGVLLLG